MSKRILCLLILTLLLTSSLALVFIIKPVKASGPITIRADGSIDPDTAPISTVDQVIYTFTDDIDDSIVVERDNIVIDGANHVLSGRTLPGQTGISISSASQVRSNVNITNLEIRSFLYGIELYNTAGNNIEGNRIINNTAVGVWMRYASSNVVTRNILEHNGVGIKSEGLSNNTIICDNNIIGSGEAGVEIYKNCNYNEISGNNIDGSHTFHVGIRVNGSFGCRILRNTIINVDGEEGASAILLEDHPAVITENTIKNNCIGMNLLINPNDAEFVLPTYHNNIVGNQFQAHGGFPTRMWDGGYPSGGNYWSDYNGIDLYSGPSQNEAGADGIGDTPYQGDNFVDRYPLMGSFGGITQEGTNVAVFPSENVGLIFGSVETGGSATVTESLAGPAPPSGFMISSGIYYDIQTTATWSGTALVRIIYDDSGMTPEQESNLRLMQWDEPSSSWLDITQRVDTENNVIYGAASHFSIVAVVSRIPYYYGGILQPINPDGSSIFKLGRTVPVKFQLRDAKGNFIITAVARLYVLKISNGITGDELEAVSTSVATTGNLFRYDSTSNQYIFNLDTKPLSQGTWRLRIELDDGTSQTVNIGFGK